LYFFIVHFAQDIIYTDYPEFMIQKECYMHKNKLILHIGTHKTGTTSIQNVLESSKDKLKDFGFLYPQTNREPWPNLTKHCSVFEAAINNDTSVAEYERKILLDEFNDSNCHTMILSEEGLSKNEKCFSDFFKTFKKDFEISVICYLRRQDFFIESMYNQFVREAKRESRTITQFVGLNKMQDWMNYYEMIEKWKNIADHIMIRNFDEELKTKGLLNSFSSLAGLEELGLAELRDNNSVDMSVIPGQNHTWSYPNNS